MRRQARLTDAATLAIFKVPSVVCASARRPSGPWRTRPSARARSGERGEARVLGGVLEADGLAVGPRSKGVGAQLALAGGAAEAVHVPHAARAAGVRFAGQAAGSKHGGAFGA